MCICLLLTVFQSSIKTVNRCMVAHHVVRNMGYGAPRSERDMMRRRDCLASRKSEFADSGRKDGRGGSQETKAHGGCCFHGAGGD